MKLKVISWIASTFSLVGTVLNAYHIIWCWPLWIFGNFFWIYWSYQKKEWAQFVLWIVFEGANMFGYYQWTLIN